MSKRDINWRGLPRAVAVVGACFQALFMVGSARADIISPSSYTAAIDVGGSVTVNKTVTVTRTPTVQTDIFFLADTTGSMGGAISSVRTGASNILSTTGAVGNVNWGVGEYKDVGDTFVYRLNTGITGNTANVTSGLNQWGAAGGGDTPEANLFGLNAMAAASTGWRTGSRKLAVWFGDAPGHDPSNGVPETQAIAALNAQGISVLAVDVGSMNSTGQATRITNATGGKLYSGISGSCQQTCRVSSSSFL